MIKFETLNGWDFFGCCIAVSGFPYQRVLRKKLNFIYFSDGIFSLSFLFASLVLSFLSSTIENHYYVCLKKRNSLVYVFTIVIALFVQSIKLPPVFLLYIASFSNLFSVFFLHCSFYFYCGFCQRSQTSWKKIASICLNILLK